MTDRIGPGSCQCRFQPAVAINTPGLIAAVPVDGSCTCLGNEAGEQFKRISRRDMQYAAKRFLQRCQGMVKPPAVGRADTVRAGGTVIKDKDGQHVAGRGSGAERRIVGKPQILAEPENGERSRHNSPSRRDAVIEAYWRKRLPLLCENDLVPGFCRTPVTSR